MDDLTKAKQLLLAEYERLDPGSSQAAYRQRSENARKQHIQSQASMDTIRARAQREEEEENRRRREREARQQVRAVQREQEKEQSQDEEEAHIAPLSGEEAQEQAEPEAINQKEQASAPPWPADEESGSSDQIQAALDLIAAQARQRAGELERREQAAIQAALVIEDQLAQVEASVQGALATIRAALDRIVS
ncbi:hypothetical protein [Dictyobacter alpinus]|nr:hypothetical protein [Dictyobacter alpinus]